MKVLFTIWAKVGTKEQRQRGTKEHRNTGTQRNTEEHRGTAVAPDKKLDEKIIYYNCIYKIK